jgi:hypothetical protein
MTPPLTGGAFMANWDGLTLGDLAERIRNTMPLNAPGSLSRQKQRGDRRVHPEVQPVPRREGRTAARGAGDEANSF